MSFCSVLPSGPGSDSRRPALPAHSGVPEMGSSESGQDFIGLGLLISDKVRVDARTAVKVCVDRSIFRDAIGGTMVLHVGSIDGGIFLC